MKTKEIFLARASSAGTLLSQPRSKADRDAGKLSKTAETLVHNWLKEGLYKRKKGLYSKYLDKGIVVEQESLQRVAEHFDLGMILETNSKWFTDAYFSGTPDLILDDYVIDLKNSWDMTTFPLFDQRITNQLYIMQLQVYMHLTKRKKAKLIYCLTNTPEHLILQDIKYRSMDLRNTGRTLVQADFDGLAEEVRAGHVYDTVSDDLRFKSFDLAYDAEAIEKLQMAVLRVRSYIDTIVI